MPPPPPPPIPAPLPPPSTPPPKEKPMPTGGAPVSSSAKPAAVEKSPGKAVNRPPVKNPPAKAGGAPAAAAVPSSGVIDVEGPDPKTPPTRSALRAGPGGVLEAVGRTRSEDPTNQICSSGRPRWSVGGCFQHFLRDTRGIASVCSCRAEDICRSSSKNCKYYSCDSCVSRTIHRSKEHFSSGRIGHRPPRTFGQLHRVPRDWHITNASEPKAVQAFEQQSSISDSPICSSCRE
eukprot:s5990_g1.t1